MIVLLNVFFSGTHLSQPNVTSRPDQVDPALIKFTNILDKTAEVVWIEVADIDFYSITLQPNNTGATVEPNRVPKGGRLKASLKGLQPASHYTVIIRTNKGSEQSLPSIRAFFTTGEVPFATDNNVIIILGKNLIL